MTEEYLEKMAMELGVGVVPYTEAELIELYKQVSEAAAADSGEGNE